MTRVNVQNGQQQKNSKFPAKLSEETPWNKLRVDHIGPYGICLKGRMPLILKDVTMIDPVTRWFEVMQYRNKKVMTIAKLVESTWMVQYPCPV